MLIPLGGYCLQRRFLKASLLVTYAATSWSSPPPFIRFYRRNMTAAPLSVAVLNVAVEDKAETSSGSTLRDS